ncbi:MAG: hypothetical protein GX307_00255 [Euryarchaeota archaeon]|mgnify:CR=1 FL=1|nr:hypothetical protein [Euryarchaeota archaeon]
MSENSKEMAGASSFGLRLRFQSPKGMGREELATLVVRMLRSMGEAVDQTGRALIGHIKVFLTVPGGSLKANLVDLDLGPETENDLPGELIESGEIRYMAAVIGLTDEEVEQLMEGSLGSLQHKLKIDVLEHKHEH